MPGPDEDKLELLSQTGGSSSCRLFDSERLWGQEFLPPQWVTVLTHPSTTLTHPSAACLYSQKPLDEQAICLKNLRQCVLNHRPYHLLAGTGSAAASRIFHKQLACRTSWSGRAGPGLWYNLSISHSTFMWFCTSSTALTHLKTVSDFLCSSLTKFSISQFAVRRSSGCLLLRSLGRGFDISSSASKMELFGQEEGGGKILSTGGLGSCCLSPCFFSI